MSVDTPRSVHIARCRSLLRSVRLWFLGLGPTLRRGIDIAIASTVLVLVSPILTIAAIAIRLESKGSVLFSQLRSGLYGKPFRMWKMRSMCLDAEAQKRRLMTAGSAMRFKMRKDPRITRVGAVIRKLSIDELPQLFNVLRGDMTLIGPRPAPVSECALYTPRALRRMEVLPGLTCLWQIRGRSDLSFEEQVDLDIEYIDRATAIQEAQILVQTIPAVITGRGAY